MEEQWRAELDELRGIVLDLSERLAATEEAREAQDDALMLAISQHPASGPALEPVKGRRRHLRLAPRLALKLVPRAVRSG